MSLLCQSSQEHGDGRAACNGKKLWSRAWEHDISVSNAATCIQYCLTVRPLVKGREWIDY